MNTKHFTCDEKKIIFILIKAPYHLVEFDEYISLKFSYFGNFELALVNKFSKKKAPRHKNTDKYEKRIHLRLKKHVEYYISHEHDHIL